MTENTPSSPWLIIEQLRAKHDISKKLLADKLQINYNYLVDLLNGRYQSNIDNQKLRVLAEIFQMSMADLIKLIHADEDGAAGVQMPLYPLVSGEANAALATKQPAEWLAPPSPATSDAFAVRIKDDTLFPPCHPDSVFVISPHQEPRLGDLVLITLKDHRCWLLELNRVENDMAVLRYYNARYQHIMVPLKDILSVYPVTAIHLK
jgi:transcriptional regulator with XRE-family HTH domain